MPKYAVELLDWTEPLLKDGKPVVSHDGQGQVREAAGIHHQRVQQRRLGRFFGVSPVL